MRMLASAIDIQYHKITHLLPLILSEQRHPQNNNAFMTNWISPVLHRYQAKMKRSDKHVLALIDNAACHFYFRSSLLLK
jgi:hypothetical protein